MPKTSLPDGPDKSPHITIVYGDQWINKPRPQRLADPTKTNEEGISAHLYRWLLKRIKILFSVACE
jgi:hypothetical protein